MKDIMNISCKLKKYGARGCPLHYEKQFGSFIVCIQWSTLDTTADMPLIRELAPTGLNIWSHTIRRNLVVLCFDWFHYLPPPPPALLTDKIGVVERVWDYLHVYWILKLAFTGQGCFDGQIVRSLRYFTKVSMSYALHPSATDPSALCLLHNYW